MEEIGSIFVTESLQISVPTSNAAVTEYESIQDSGPDNIIENESFKIPGKDNITKSFKNSGSTTVTGSFENPGTVNDTENFKNRVSTIAGHENLQQRRLSRIQQIRHEVSNDIIKINTNGKCLNGNKDDEDECIDHITLSDLELVLVFYKFSSYSFQTVYCFNYFKT